MSVPTPEPKPEEVIVRMRAEMIAMQRQFGKILEELIEEIRNAAGSTPRG